MKRNIFYLFMVSVILTLVQVELHATESKGSYTTILQKQPTSGGDQEWDDSDQGHRVPARPINCSICAESGVIFHGSSDEIISYEIWDIDGGMCLFASSDEYSFISEIFASDGEFQIRMYSDVYIYTGYISTL